MESNLAGVLVTPSIIEFRDVKPGVSYQNTITVKNISKKSRAIRYYGPASNYLFLIVKNPEKPVASGLEVSATVEYKSDDNKEKKDKLVITVDDEIIDVPIIVYPQCPRLELKTLVDFGNVVARSKVISQDLTLYNRGSAPGDFKIKYLGDKPIAIIPKNGTVNANSTQKIKFEYVTTECGKFNETARVKLDGSEAFSITIKGNVVDGCLEILDFESKEKVNCVRFGSTYYGTDITEPVLLYNNSPETTCYVGILNEDAIGMEAGVDLSKTTSASLKERAKARADGNSEPGHVNELTSLVTMIPNQGTLRPFEEITAFFRFSPRWNYSKKGFNCTQQAPPRQDFALFVQLKTIGTGGDSLPTDNNDKDNSKVLEVAVTATALPVLLSLSPNNVIDFGECPNNEHVDILCSLVNSSACLPVVYRFRHVAHYSSQPKNGKVPPEQQRDVILSFAPNQIGTFKTIQFVDVYGDVADKNNPFKITQSVIHSLPINFIGKSDPITVYKKPVYNNGITPKITNEVGLYADTYLQDMTKDPKAAMLSAQSTDLHLTAKSDDNGSYRKIHEINLKNAKIAFPNDRSCSIRPSDTRDSYRTIFTGMKRHTYVDTDYAYNNEEVAAIENHKQKYRDYINELRENRINKLKSKDFEATNNETDIAIKPAAGLRPKKLHIEEMKSCETERPPTPPNQQFKLLSSKDIKHNGQFSSKKVKDGLNAIPTTAAEKRDCQRSLTPQDLDQIIIGPSTLDFGKVCLRSINKKNLDIVNNLNQHVHIVVNVDCKELRQSSPLSQIIPPNSRAVLPIIFESNTKGHFQRSLDYKINGVYKNHVTVFGDVVPVELKLSTNDISLEPLIGQPVEAGMRDVVFVKNSLNYPAEFQWTPILSSRGTAFSIRPASGVVEPFSELACEVVFHPSFLAPEEGSFKMQVQGGNCEKLFCSAKFGVPNIQFIDRRLLFGQIPLHLTTTKVALLKNIGNQHAYFQVTHRENEQNVPGLSVNPQYGVIPVGGTTEVEVSITPAEIIKFDTHVDVKIRGWKSIELRMSATVEMPSIDIDIPSFNLGGVCVGTKQVTPFKLINKANSKARMDFDLTRYRDFSINFINGKVGNQNFPDDLCVFSVELEAKQIVDCELVFKPTEIASYDFILAVSMNNLIAPTPSVTPYPPTPAPSNKNSIQRALNPTPSVAPNITTPRRKVIATALRQPLQMSHHSLKFVISPSQHQLATSSGIGHHKDVLLVNNSNKNLKWTVDVDSSPLMDDGVFKFVHSSGMPFMSHGSGAVSGSLTPGQTYSLGVLFCPKQEGVFEVKLPIYLDDDASITYQHLSLFGRLKSPKLIFSPPAIILTPVPLSTEDSVEFQILGSDYTVSSELRAELPEVECEDGSRVKPLTLTFPGHVEACCGDEDQQEPCVLNAKVTFKSVQPVSFSDNIVFIDQFGNRFYLPVSATADNSLLTIYPFLALHRGDHQIVCEQGRSLKGRKSASSESTSVGEAVLIPCTSPGRPSSGRPSTQATSSNFDVSSATYEPSSESVTESTEESTPAELRDGALNNNNVADSNVATASRAEVSFKAARGRLQSPELLTPRGQSFVEASRSLASVMFPLDDESDEGIFHSEVLMAMQRWFSHNGWPGGPNPIFVPHSLRSAICKKPSDDKNRSKKGAAFEQNNLKREFPTVYDMINHLCGKQVPGIPINNSLSTDPYERAKEVHWQHATLLTFLRNQGACLSSVRPEYLMDSVDYQFWSSMQTDIELKKTKENIFKTMFFQEEYFNEELFEAVSKRAWTDVLLQLVKVLVIAKITPRQLKLLPSPYAGSSMPEVDPDPIRSNVYSIGERIVLVWLNQHYEHQRATIWQDCAHGGVPPSRWVVNYDFDLMDGLVIAAAIGAHAPFLISSHLRDMYTHPTSAEQCLHNALIVIGAMHKIGIDYDIQGIDITDPNPVTLLLLSVHLYNNLPQYLPKNTINFTGALHTPIHRQIRLSNPSSKVLVYRISLAGPNASDFSVQNKDHISISPRSTVNLSVEFRSRLISPAHAFIVLVGRRTGSNIGSTLVFNLTAQIDRVNSKRQSAKATIHWSSPCYENKIVPIEVKNSFPVKGRFKISLVETVADSSTSVSNKSSNKSIKTKKVKSKVNHGQKISAVSTPKLEISDPLLTGRGSENKETKNILRAFSVSKKEVDIEADETVVVKLNFLPFHVGRRQCSVLFADETVGEFVYSVDAETTLPLPETLPFHASRLSARISSADAAGQGRGMFGGDKRVIYWKCECGQVLRETLEIPLVNAAKEKSLLLAAQQQLSSTEIERRRITGTLDSGALTAKLVENLYTNLHSTEQNNQTDEKERFFKVEVNSSFFHAPEKIHLGVKQKQNPLVHNRPGHSPDGQSDTSEIHNSIVKTKNGIIELPVTFQAAKPGHYPCRIVLYSEEDVRVYMIECTVMPEGHTADLQFSSPVHEGISQEIPIVNQTDHDWPMVAKIEGQGFSGQPTILARSLETTVYTIYFKPLYEGAIPGKLILTNTADNVDHVYNLTGNGERPLPLETLNVKCQAMKSICQCILVPNITSKKLQFRVECDIPFLSGEDSVVVLNGRSEEYQVNIAPMRRGLYKGVLAFVADGNKIREVDSDGEEMAEDEEAALRRSELSGYRVWFAVTIEVEPAPAQSTLSMRCPCQKETSRDININNPTSDQVIMSVTLDGPGLSGPSEIVLLPRQKSVYTVTYTPAVIGSYKGSIIFYSDITGEFWYNFELTAEKPTLTQLPEMECALGGSCKQPVSLNNPTDETLKLIPRITNSNNFYLERENEQPIKIEPHSCHTVLLVFTPSALGRRDHNTTITFLCEQLDELGEWIYEASGVGILPEIQDSVTILSPAGSSSTFIIPVRNPTDDDVLAEISLTDKESRFKSPFCLHLRQPDAVSVGPKSTIDIPVSFSPELMRQFEAMCEVSMRKKNGLSWHDDTKRSEGERSVSGGVRTLLWVFPIFGIPESSPAPDIATETIQCKARKRSEQTLTLVLGGTGDDSLSGLSAMKTRIYVRDQTDKQDNTRTQADDVEEEFHFRLQYSCSEAECDVEPAVALRCLQRSRDRRSGLIKLHISAIFAPFKSMDHCVELVVQASGGGVWRFPLRFQSTDAEPDDTITVEAVGLQRTSYVGFRINSQKSHPAKFSAFFAGGSDAELSVSPQSGELMPENSDGTLFKIAFTPSKYGKTFQGTLIIQTSDTQWSYRVRGVLPEYCPPTGQSSRPISGPHPDPRLTRTAYPPPNYVRDNLQLITTGVSSPIKGCRLLHPGTRLTHH